MPAYLTETTYRMCTRSEDYYSLYLQNKAAYIWVATRWTDESDDETINGATFCAVLDYMERLKKAPESIDAMLQYVIHNPHNIKDFERSEGLTGELRELRKYEPEKDWDDTTLFEGLREKARAEWFKHKAKYAVLVAGGAVQPDKNAEETGTTAAIQWLRSELLRDLHTEVPAVAGRQAGTRAIVAERLKLCEAWGSVRMHSGGFIT